MKSKILALLAVALLSPPIVANAAVLITIERINDQEALITGLGSLNFTAPQFGKNALALIDPFATDPVSSTPVNVLSSSSMTVEGIPVNFAVERGGLLIPILAFGNSTSDFPALGDFAGSLRVTLSGGSTLLGVGSFGAVQWGTADSADSQGIWQIVAASAAPEPGTLALLGLGLGLAGLAAARRRKQ